ncbi:growth arrest and DNA damage-inducible protein GADD45 gamma-like [Scleropages formosus]|uniref:Growth arrest and DNA damage inducible gamma n=1 Tax=Scleropages formosus TaxID=113540 RepID=A0A8C9RAN7_SCLFO|nr:growth arrest and DNA damage-inducible protein GADD45 gamma-like [Scleropages formosus]
MKKIHSRAGYKYRLSDVSSTALFFAFIERLLSAPCEAVKMTSAVRALRETLLTAQSEGRLTVGVYESAKIMNDDPDSVCFCVLAADEEYECDIALQIHFTLIQAFCFDNDIDIVRVTDPRRLARIVGHESGDADDAHCVLITNPAEGSWEDPALEKLHLFCEESRSVNEWVPEISLPER